MRFVWRSAAFKNPITSPMTLCSHSQSPPAETMFTEWHIHQSSGLYVTGVHMGTSEICSQRSAHDKQTRRAWIRCIAWLLFGFYHFLRGTAKRATSRGQLFNVYSQQTPNALSHAERRGVCWVRSHLFAIHTYWICSSSSSSSSYSSWQNAAICFGAVRSPIPIAPYVMTMTNIQVPSCESSRILCSARFWFFNHRSE